MTDPRSIDRNWTILDHPADIRMEVRGRTLEQLFVNAALALTSLIAPKSHGPPDTEVVVVLEGTDHEELMVDWLRELLYRNQVARFMLVRPLAITVSENRVEARLAGKTAHEDQPQQGLEVKGVTYHGLSVERTDEGYCARILLDV